MKIRPLGDEFFNADRRTDGQTDTQTDMTKLTAALRNYANAPKSSSFLSFETVVTKCSVHQPKES